MVLWSLMHEQLLVAAVLPLRMQRGGERKKTLKMWPFLLPPNPLLKDEGDVLPAGEAAQPPEAHHAEDGDLFRGWRVRRSHQHPGPHVAHPAERQSRLGPRVPLAPACEGHQVQDELTSSRYTYIYIYIYSPHSVSKCVSRYCHSYSYLLAAPIVWLNTSGNSVVSLILPFHS